MPPDILNILKNHQLQTVDTEPVSPRNLNVSEEEYESGGWVIAEPKVYSFGINESFSTNYGDPKHRIKQLEKLKTHPSKTNFVMK
jgi:hypothetical protein